MTIFRTLTILCDDADAGASDHVMRKVRVEETWARRGVLEPARNAARMLAYENARALILERDMPKSKVNQMPETPAVLPLKRGVRA